MRVVTTCKNVRTLKKISAHVERAQTLTRTRAVWSLPHPSSPPGLLWSSDAAVLPREYSRYDRVATRAPGLDGNVQPARARKEMKIPC